MNIAEFKKQLEPYLSGFINGKIEHVKATLQDPFLLTCIEYPKKLILGKGKRVRPYVAYLAYKAAGGTDLEKMMRLSLSLELFHAFCLIHDDFMDQGELRHQETTLHRFVTKQLKEDNRIGNLAHIGDSQAILVGDLLFSWAKEAFDRFAFTESGNEEAKEEANTFYYRMVDDVVLGQLIDVDTMSRMSVSKEIIEQKMQLKTSSYTFIRPMQIGCALAGKAETLEPFCQEFGSHLGLAYQVQDDMLDIVATPEETEKTLFTDLRERQHTFFTQFIREQGSPKHKKILEEIIGTDLTIDDRKQVLALFSESGAVKQGKKIIEEKLQQAEQVLHNQDFNNSSKNDFQFFIDYIRGRNK